jgi:hypothetical protein
MTSSFLPAGGCFFTSTSSTWGWGKAWAGSGYQVSEHLNTPVQRTPNPATPSHLQDEVAETGTDGHILQQALNVVLVGVGGGGTVAF